MNQYSGIALENEDCRLTYYQPTREEVETIWDYVQGHGYVFQSVRHYYLVENCTLQLPALRGIQFVSKRPYSVAIQKKVNNEDN